MMGCWAVRPCKRWECCSPKLPEISELATPLLRSRILEAGFGRILDGSVADNETLGIDGADALRTDISDAM